MMFLGCLRPRDDNSPSIVERWRRNRMFSQKPQTPTIPKTFEPKVTKGSFVFHPHDGTSYTNGNGSDKPTNVSYSAGNEKYYVEGSPRSSFSSHGESPKNKAL